MYRLQFFDLSSVVNSKGLIHSFSFLFIHHAAGAFFVCLFLSFNSLRTVDQNLPLIPIYPYPYRYTHIGNPYFKRYLQQSPHHCIHRCSSYISEHPYCSQLTFCLNRASVPFTSHQLFNLSILFPNININSPPSALSTFD